MKEQEQGGITEVFFRVFPPLAGALLASILSLTFFIASNLVLEMGTQPLAFSKFQLFGITFLSALFSNVIATTFLFLANADRYGSYSRSTLMHIFFVTVGLFVLIAPLFLTFSIEFGFHLIQFCLPFSAISAALILAVSTERERPVLAAYQAIISGGLLLVIVSFLFPKPIPAVMMPFFLMPIAWLIIPSVFLVVERIGNRFIKPMTDQ